MALRCVSDRQQNESHHDQRQYAMRVQDGMPVGKNGDPQYCDGSHKPSTDVVSHIPEGHLGTTFTSRKPMHHGST